MITLQFVQIVATFLLFGRNVHSQLDTTECGKSKYCFFPNDCKPEGCDVGLALGVEVVNKTTYLNIEMVSHQTSDKKIYMAVAFSRDNKSGDAFVTEFSSYTEGDQITPKLSYNNLNGINSDVKGLTDADMKKVLTKYDGSFTPKKELLYAKVTQQITQLPFSNVEVLNEENSKKTYYVILTRGETVQTGLIYTSPHTFVSSAPIDFDDILNMDTKPAKGVFMASQALLVMFFSWCLV